MAKLTLNFDFWTIHFLKSENNFHFFFRSITEGKASFFVSNSAARSKVGHYQSAYINHIDNLKRERERKGRLIAMIMSITVLKLKLLIYIVFVLWIIKMHNVTWVTLKWCEYVPHARNLCWRHADKKKGRFYSVRLNLLSVFFSFIKKGNLPVTQLNQGFGREGGSQSARCLVWSALML